jgi:hypothetical protein
MDDSVMGKWVWIGKAGKIVDVAESAGGRVLAKIASPDHAYRGQRPEWIEFENGAALDAAIMDNADPMIRQEIEKYRRMAELRLSEIVSKFS